jgi:hypothetical protein
VVVLLQMLGTAITNTYHFMPGRQINVVWGIYVLALVVDTLVLANLFVALVER